MYRRSVHPRMCLSLMWAWTVVAGLMAGGVFASDEEEGELSPRQPFVPGAVEVQFTDKSTLKLVLADERIEIQTRHGKLQIPAVDVLRIEFAQRLPEAMVEAIDRLLGQLRDPDPDVQKAAGAELLAMRDQALLPLMKAAGSGDPSIAPQAAKLLGRLQAIVPKKDLEAIRDHDFIETAGEKIAGRITMPSLKVRTSQFGELALKLADARSLRHQSLSAPEVIREEIVALPDPGNLQVYNRQHGKVLAFTVTGKIDGGHVWGTDVYTTDSQLSKAAVHAGVIRPGETGVVRVKILPSPDSFAGSTKNGVTTSNYGRFSGAYQILKDDEE